MTYLHTKHIFVRCDLIDCIDILGYKTTNIIILVPIKLAIKLNYYKYGV